MISSVSRPDADFCRPSSNQGKEYCTHCQSLTLKALRPSCGHIVCADCVKRQALFLPKLAHKGIYICYDCGEKIQIPPSFYSVLEGEAAGIRSTLFETREGPFNPQEHHDLFYKPICPPSSTFDNSKPVETFDKEIPSRIQSNFTSPIATNRSHTLEPPLQAYPGTYVNINQGHGTTLRSSLNQQGFQNPLSNSASDIQKIQSLNPTTESYVGEYKPGLGRVIAINYQPPKTTVYAAQTSVQRIRPGQQIGPGIREGPVQEVVRGELDNNHINQYRSTSLPSYAPQAPSVPPIRLAQPQPHPTSVSPIRITHNPSGPLPPVETFSPLESNLKSIPSRTSPRLLASRHSAQAREELPLALATPPASTRAAPIPTFPTTTYTAHPVTTKITTHPHRIYRSSKKEPPCPEPCSSQNLPLSSLSASIEPLMRAAERTSLLIEKQTQVLAETIKNNFEKERDCVREVRQQEREIVRKMEERKEIEKEELKAGVEQKKETLAWLDKQIEAKEEMYAKKTQELIDRQEEVQQKYLKELQNLREKDEESLKLRQQKLEEEFKLEIQRKIEESDRRAQEEKDKIDQLRAELKEKELKLEQEFKEKERAKKEELEQLEKKKLAFEAEVQRKKEEELEEKKRNEEADRVQEQLRELARRTKVNSMKKPRAHKAQKILRPLYDLSPISHPTDIISLKESLRGSFKKDPNDSTGIYSNIVGESRESRESGQAKNINPCHKEIELKSTIADKDLTSLPDPAIRIPKPKIPISEKLAYITAGIGRGMQFSTHESVQKEEGHSKERTLTDDFQESSIIDRRDPQGFGLRNNPNQANTSKTKTIITSDGSRPSRISAPCEKRGKISQSKNQEEALLIEQYEEQKPLQTLNIGEVEREVRDLYEKIQKAGNKQEKRGLKQNKGEAEKALRELQRSIERSQERGLRFQEGLRQGQGERLSKEIKRKSQWDLVEENEELIKANRDQGRSGSRKVKQSFSAINVAQKPKRVFSKSFLDQKSQFMESKGHLNLNQSLSGVDIEGFRKHVLNRFFGDEDKKNEWWKNNNPENDLKQNYDKVEERKTNESLNDFRSTFYKTKSLVKFDLEKTPHAPLDSNDYVRNSQSGRHKRADSLLNLTDSKLNAMNYSISKGRCASNSKGHLASSFVSPHKPLGTSLLQESSTSQKMRYAGLSNTLPRADPETSQKHLRYLQEKSRQVSSSPLNDLALDKINPKAHHCHCFLLKTDITQEEKINNQPLGSLANGKIVRGLIKETCCDKNH